MRRRKKIALALLALLVATQAPFAYRRYRLGRLRAAIDAVNSARAPAEDEAFAEFKGVFHVHSYLGGHSQGTFDEIVGGAKANGLDFVVMTEHAERDADTAAATLSGVREGVLFVNGSELAAASGERLFALPGLPAPAPPPADERALAALARSQGRAAFVAYPEEVRDWDLGGFDGIEVYNLYTNSKRISYPILLFDALWSYRAHPDLLFSTFYAKPRASLRRWDELTAAGLRLSAVAGSDAHSNVRLGAAGLFQIKFDPYERSFRVVRNHVLVERGRALDQGALLDALRRGRSFIAFDLFGDSAGFRFTAEGPSGSCTMGDEMVLPEGGEVRLYVATPVAGRVVFLRDGGVLHEARDSTRAEMGVSDRGVYRVEVYLDQLRDFLGDDRPWIISNAIYVR